MKYVSIDIETTGLDPDRCQVIEIAAIVDDTAVRLNTIHNLPTFHCYVSHESFRGEAYALSMHSRIFRILAGKETALSDIFVPRAASQMLLAFLAHNFGGAVQAAGKNFASFDLRFLRRMEGFSAAIFHHRYLDPASIFAEPDDEKLPSTEECLRRCGLPATVAHTATEDALDVIRMVRRGLGVAAHGDPAGEA